VGIVWNYIVIHYTDSSCQLLAVTMGRRNKLVYPCRVEGWLNVCGKFVPVSSFHFMWHEETCFFTNLAGSYFLTP